MKEKELNTKQNQVDIPSVWLAFSFVLLFIASSMLFISDPEIKYGGDIAFAILNSTALISCFFLCKKPILPWGLLITAIVVINGSFINTSLIFFGYVLNTQLSLWFEISGIALIYIFCANLLYMFEKQYNLKGLSLDFTLITLSSIIFIFLFSPDFLDNFLNKLNLYEKSLIFNVALGIILLSLMMLSFLLSRKLERKSMILGAMVLFLSIHFFLDAYANFAQLSNNEFIHKLSWLFYQLPSILAIHYIFTGEYNYKFNVKKVKKMGLKFLWVATIIGSLVVPIGIMYRWYLNLPNINNFIIASMAVVMSLIVIWRIVILIKNYEKHRKKLKDFAFTDSLTGISNYLGVQTQVLPDMKNIFVLSINIEDFKSINDMYDRKFGDEVLRSLANRISDSPGIIHCARTTGDNFLAIMRVKENNIYKSFIAFQKDLGLWDTVYNRRVAVPLTFGGCHSVEPENIDILVSNAERALKESREHKVPFTLFKNIETNNSIKFDLPRHELREILQNSIDKNELPIHFQPIYKTHTGKLKALEMLIRVDSLKHGLLVPGQFLEQAKSYGLLTELTHICINMIAKEIHRLPDVTININLPPYMLNDRETLNNFIKFFQSKDLSAERFCIEVTEDGDIPTDSLIPAINLLKEAGFSIAMDDFGTGYSSLGRLSSLPFDTVKIDRSLLLAADNGDRTILESAINLVKRLGVAVVVEGVETLEQLALVRELGADSAQGYLFSKPVPVTNKNQFPLDATEIISEF